MLLLHNMEDGLDLHFKWPGKWDSGPDIASVPEECPEVLVQLMQSCWAGTPAKRPPFSEILPLLEQVEVPGE